MIKVGRFQTRPGPIAASKRRLLKKRSPKPGSPCLIGADSNLLVHEHGSMPIEAYADGSFSNTMTLTQREADLIALANPGVRPPVAAESVLPWLPQQQFVDNAEINHRRLVQLMKKYRKHLFLAADYCDAAWNTVCNAVRMTNTLDAAFYHAWHLPLQDAYVLEESRPGRTVVAIDFNAMYGACMQGAFPRPSTLRRVVYDRLLDLDEVLPVGLYRCRLEGEITDFIRRYNPFRAFYSGRYLAVSLVDGLEVDLNEFEIAFYAKHFSSIFILDAVVSDDVIKHPLAKEASRAFARRRNFKTQGNKALAGIEKFKMTLLSSCASRPGMQSTRFERPPEAIEFLVSEFGIARNKGEPDKVFAGSLSGRRGITLNVRPDTVVVKHPKLTAGTACFSLSQRIVARGRTKLLEMMERLSKISKEVEICYCNIDSIHFSMPADESAKVLSELQSEATQEMGSFKIEAVANHGLWIEPGRYWLYSDTIVKFANQGINDGATPFKTSSVHVASHIIDDLSIPLKVRIEMARSLSDAKDIVLTQSGIWEHRAFLLNDTSTFNDFVTGIAANRNSLSRKMAAFEDLREQMTR